MKKVAANRELLISKLVALKANDNAFTGAHCIGHCISGTGY